MRWLATLSLLLILPCLGCNTSSIADKPMDRVDRTVKDARKEMTDAVKDMRAEYEKALDKTETTAGNIRTGVNSDLEKVQADLTKKVEDLDHKLQERIEQMRSSAQQLITQGDAALEARINQIFAELRLFVQQTLLQIQVMIQPVLTFANSATELTKTTSTHIEKVATSIEKLFSGITISLEAFRTGKNPDGTPVGWIGIGTAILALLKGVTDSKKRTKENEAQGDRWHETEIDSKVETKVMAIIAKLILEGKLAVPAQTSPPAAPRQEVSNASVPQPPPS